MKKVVYRRCVATNTQYEKKQLIRIVKNSEGLVFVDLTGKANGRGAYIAKTIEALTIAKTRKSLARALDIVIPDNIYLELEKIINE